MGRNDYCNTGWDIVYGASGTMRVIAELMPDHTAGALITRQGLNNLFGQTIQEGEVAASSVSKLRRDVLPAGLAILKAIPVTTSLDFFWLIKLNHRCLLRRVRGLFTLIS